MTATLDVKGIVKRFGGLVAVNGVSIDVAPAAITSLIGPNGAGKTTLFHCLTGVLDPDEGDVLLEGSSISGLPTHERARRGVGRTFQRLEVFGGLTVFENLQVAAEAGRPGSSFRGVLSLRHPDDPAVTEVVDAVLERVGIGHLAHRPAGDLPTGALRLVELGRALCTSPKVLLLDELAAGLDDRETEALADVLRGLARDGMAILLIEHDMDLVMSVSSRIHVVEFGTLIASGTPSEIVDDPKVRAAYLGTGAST